MSSLNRAERIAVLVFILVVLGIVFYVVVPFSDEGVSCGPAAAEAWQTTSPTNPFDGEVDRLLTERTASACREPARRRLVTGGVALVLDGVALVATLLVLRDPVAPPAGPSGRRDDA